MWGISNRPVTGRSSQTLSHPTEMNTVPSVYFVHYWFAEVTNSVTSETKGSSPFSHNLVTGAYPYPTECTPPSQPISLTSILFPSSHQLLCLPSGLFPSGLATKINLVYFSLLYHACYLTRPPQSPWLDLPNDIWGWVQIMKFLIVQLSPFSRHINPLRSKYSSQNPVLKHPQSIHFP
jgi:hypothetical protein